MMMCQLQDTSPETWTVWSCLVSKATLTKLGEDPILLRPTVSGLAFVQLVESPRNSARVQT